ncbi:MAG: fibronectin type III domain-containing protein [Alphaproteobacteria bacterium]|nr:fibronectin type III domain-containing protein [Alphaproteobacteria bacterium]
MTAKRIEGSWLKALLWLGLGFVLGFITYRFAFPLEAEAQRVVQLPQYICHATPPDTASNGWVKNTPATLGVIQGHVSNDRADIVPPFGNFQGLNWDTAGQAVWNNDCEEPNQREENSISIDRPEISCGVNQFRFEGSWTYRWDGNTYVKFIINGREPEVFYGDHEWWTGVLTLAPTDYVIRAELWGEWRDNWTLKASQDGRFTIDECDVPEPTPVEPTPVPEQPTSSSASAPICSDFVPEQAPANAHVVRNGSSATVNAHIPEGNNANIYYKENDADGWQHAVADIQVTGGYLSYTINDLDPNTGYTFGVQAGNGCAGGEIVAVVIDPPANGETFMFSFWEWLN